MDGFYYFNCMKKIVLFSIILFSIFACSEHSDISIKEKKKIDVAQKSLFEVLPPEKTGVFFLNELKENLNNNGLYYEYYYNGGGVAVADFNNDGLIDIYFVHSTESNALYLNTGKMKFRNVTKTSNSGGIL